MENKITNIVHICEKLKKNNIRPCILHGSMLLEFFNLRKANDIDLVVPDISNYLHLGTIKKSRLNGKDYVEYKLDGMDLSIFGDDGFGKKFNDISKFLLDEDIYIPSFIELASWKINSARSKDLEDAILLISFAKNAIKEIEEEHKS